MESPRQKRHFKGEKTITLIVLLVVLVEVLFFARPVPAVYPITTFAAPSPINKVALAWPSYGQSAIGAVGYGVLDQVGAQTPMPTASVTKTVTALTVLKQKPLPANGQGPTLTLTADDVALYNSYYSQGGSVAAVAAGEQISEYQALQALLLPSANNMADTLAIWAYGSLPNYIAAANSYVKGLGLTQTTIADASGFSSDTVSTAHDLVLIGEQLMQQPALAQISSQQQATVPVAGVVRNTNWLLGTDNITGIKTGNTDAAGGVYLFAANQPAGSSQATIIGAVMAAPNLLTAISDGRKLSNSAAAGFSESSVVKAGQVVGSYSAPWGSKANIVAKEGASFMVWGDTKITSQLQLSSIKAPAKADTKVGELTLSANGQTKKVPLTLQNDLLKPTIPWRLFN
jgi:D-alanyl-D-alanine carboxypeptidase (penicillin-binding protein 5/6)